MGTDPDRIRVDLIRAKRQVYISYPEGSPERKEFMLASKMNELRYLQKLAPHDMMDLMLEEYMAVVKLEALQIFTSLALGASLGLTLLGYHTLHPSSFLLSLWPIPIGLGIGFASQHIYHLVQNWRRLKPFKDDFLHIQSKITKLLNEIKNLAK